MIYLIALHMAVAFPLVCLILAESQRVGCGTSNLCFNFYYLYKLFFPAGLVVKSASIIMHWDKSGMLLSKIPEKKEKNGRKKIQSHHNACRCKFWIFFLVLYWDHLDTFFVEETIWTLFLLKDKVGNLDLDLGTSSSPINWNYKVHSFVNHILKTTEFGSC